jgi:hypothetical protein
MHAHLQSGAGLRLVHRRHLHSGERRGGEGTTTGAATRGGAQRVAPGEGHICGRRRGHVVLGPLVAQVDVYVVRAGAAWGRVAGELYKIR